MLPSENSLSFTLQNQFGGLPQAVLVEGNTAYLAVGPRLVAVDVTNPTAPQFLGQSLVLPDVLYDISQQGSFIFGAALRGGLVVLNVSDPTDIQLVSSGPNYAGAEQPYAIQVEVSGERAFVVNNNTERSTYDLIWFDLSTPADPAFLNTMPIDSHRGFSAAGDHLFIATRSGIQVIDPQDPTQEVSRIEAGQEIHYVQTAVYNHLLYLFYVGRDAHLAIYDWSDPANPQMIPQSSPISPDYFSEMSTNESIMAHSSTFAENGFCRTTMTVFSLAEAQAPQKTAEFDPENCVTGMDGSGNYLYLVGYSGLQVFHTADPTNPQLVGSYTNPDGFHQVDGFLPGQPTSYLLSGEGQGSFITALDMSQDPPVSVAQSTPILNDILMELFLAGQALVAPVWNQGLSIFDASSLEQLYDASNESRPLVKLDGTAVSGSIYYMPIEPQFSFTGEIGAFDLSDPANPQLIGRVDTGLELLDMMALGNGTLYLLGDIEPRKLVILDISVPNDPKLLSTLSLTENASRLTLVGNLLYITCEQSNCQTLTVVDVSDAERPFLLNQWQLPFDVSDAVAVGQQVYFTSSNNIVWAVDASQPAQPKVIGSIDLPGWYGRLTAANNTSSLRPAAPDLSSPPP